MPHWPDSRVALQSLCRRFHVHRLELFVRERPDVWDIIETKLPRDFLDFTLAPILWPQFFSCSRPRPYCMLAGQANASAFFDLLAVIVTIRPFLNHTQDAFGRDT